MIIGVLVQFGVLPFLAGDAWFWFAFVSGGVTAIAANLVRPRYESTAGRWRAFYDFLLKQSSPAGCYEMVWGQDLEY